MNNPVKYLSATDVLNKHKFPLVEVHVPEWGGNIMLRPLNAHQREYFNEVQTAQGTNIFHLTAVMVMLSACDTNGKRLFSEDDLDLLKEHDFRILDNLFKEISALNGFSRNEEAEGNDSPPPKDSSMD